MNKVKLNLDKQIDNRNYGIDALRLFAMFMVTILHVLGHGGVLKASAETEYNNILWLLETIAYCAVNCYAIITGFVSYSEKEKPYIYSKYIKTWLQVFFYSLGITLLFKYSYGDVTNEEMIMGIFPAVTRLYWYFSAYTALFFAVPFLNRLVRTMSKKQTTAMIMLLFAVYICYNFEKDQFRFTEGYGFVWLAIMYLFGAWIKKCDISSKVKSRYAFIVLVLSVLLSWLNKILVTKDEPSKLISYISPTVVLMAVCWVIIFSRLKVKWIAQKIIKFLSPAAFGVYLVHEHPMINKTFIKDKFLWILEYEGYLVPVMVLCGAASVFAICLCVERIRITLFKLLRIDKLVYMASFKLEMLLKKLTDKLLNKIFKNDR